MTWTVGSLFSGYGGIELGLEETGEFTTIWHSEIEPYPSAILAERWPGVPNLGDIKKVNWETVQRPNVLVGGFPCQDISQAGKGRGIIKGETRSGLWGEFHKAIRILRPDYVIIENVSAITGRGLNIVLADLAQEGYDAEWCDIRASDFGAPHKRERLFIVAYPSHSNTDCGRHFHREFEEQSAEGGKHAQRELVPVRSNVPNTESERRGRGHNKECATQEREVLQREQEGGEVGCETSRCSDASDTDLSGQQEQREQEPTRKEHSALERHSGWETECDMDRVAYGITKGLDQYIWRERIKALGNGVVPQVATFIGEKILEAER